MKDDAPLPAEVPRKRRQIEAALDRHIAMWLASDILTPSERRRLEDEKARRKALVPDRPVGLLVGGEGVTPAQLDALPVALAGATEVHHPGVASRVHSACRALGVPVVVHRGDMRAVVRASGEVVAAPSQAAPGPSDVWEMVRYTRHRRLPVRVLLPSGETLREERE